MQYDHKDKERSNNPLVGLVTPETDPEKQEKKQYQYDPHLDPQLQWAGKAEHTAFDVPTVSLHVHERIDPMSIVESVKKRKEENGQLSLFESQKKPLREAIEFYKHKQGWTNRLIAGDSLLVMNSLIEKEAMAGSVQMVYFDPPYGIKYGSNFQPFVNKRDVKDGKDQDLTAEPEMIKAFRDTWELGIHSYLTYIRDRLLLAKEMLSESGSIFVQISDENLHHIRGIMDEVFGAENFVSLISYASTSGFASSALSRAGDYIIWYAKYKPSMKYAPLYKPKVFGGDGSSTYSKIELEDGTQMSISEWEKMNQQSFNYDKRPKGSRIFSLGDLTSQDPPKEPQPFEFKGTVYNPKNNCHWKANYPEGMNMLVSKNRIKKTRNSIGYVRYFDDFPLMQMNNLWTDTGSSFMDKYYTVQTSTLIIQRCLLMTTDPGDLVLDITCGSGTTAFVAEQWGRRWITCDTSRVATTLAKQRLMTAKFDYYKLAQEQAGVGAGFIYKKVPHITLKSIANNEPAPEETLYDQPEVDRKKVRITGPFTVEAVPSPIAKSPDQFDTEDQGSDTSIARSGETLRQSNWRDELQQTGIRTKGGQKIEFSRVEPLSGTKYLQAEAETIDDVPRKVLVCFGPEYAPLEQRLVEEAWQEARSFKPDILLFCAFQFDNEAAKDIDELTPEKAGMQLLKVQMNADLLTDDLKKKRASNESFWLMGQPDVMVHTINDGDDKGKIQVEVLGFDYYDPRTGNVESGGKNNIAMWLLDTDYDERSLFPSQVFFPMAGSKDGWAKLSKDLKADLDEDKLNAFKGTISIPFEKGHKIAVKIIDDRGIECLRVITL